MRKLIFTGAFALVLGLGTSNSAFAQLTYNYTIPADGGTENSGTRWTSYGPQSYTNFYSPVAGYMSQTSGNINTLFSRGTYSSIYSPFTGYMTETSGTMRTPFGNASYLSYYSPFTGPVYQAQLNNPASANNKNLTNFNYTQPIFPAGQFWLAPANNAGKRGR